MAPASWMLASLLVGLVRVRASLGFSQSMDSDFTFSLAAAQKECFYQTMREGATLEIEYQVIAGAGLDVDFYLEAPNGNILQFEQRKANGVHSVETENGDYMFCFDNTFSSLSEKIIFFEIILDNMENENESSRSWEEVVWGGELHDMKLRDILQSVYNVKARLSRSSQIQGMLRAFEARDRNLQEGNYDCVNLWSAVNLTVMLIVSGLQVYMLRSLFRGDSRSRT
ncbi:transmembrane emp24 domain-containing protein 5 [Callorhinchus milii]|uniref:Transmembrane emp24 domain-containing protein 5-like protein n=1 Tax=Callorhinchus milii TaxID=7868 RepID=V9L7M4_CALMI|nr:transmembrane emp24 domain-containing protein 5 [Callorhinchus milii]|eukprot:gi/632956136/ref/XP_007893809.1/ PREDICTED: transmembrane emp24 domain-containing protein 5 [Callorhinchus milii]